MELEMVNAMRDTITIDGAGRLVLPKALRERFNLRSGAKLELITREEFIELRPLNQEPALVKTAGWWVHQGVPDSAEDLVDAVARMRDDRIGNLKK